MKLEEQIANARRMVVILEDRPEDREIFGEYVQNLFPDITVIIPEQLHIAVPTLVDVISSGKPMVVHSDTYLEKFPYSHDYRSFGLLDPTGFAVYERVRDLCLGSRMPPWIGLSTAYDQGETCRRWEVLGTRENPVYFHEKPITLDAYETLITQAFESYPRH